MQLNNWDGAAVERAEKTWGDKRPQYVQDAYEFLTGNGSRFYLDLGCGFGRFLDYLKEAKTNFEYLGVDSSEDMIQRAKERHDDKNFYIADILAPHYPLSDLGADAVLCQAVLIHLPLDKQIGVMKNLGLTQAKRLTFDINQKTGVDDKETTIRLGDGNFRMTWNNVERFREVVETQLPSKEHNTKYWWREYPIHNRITKTQFFIERL